MEKSETHTLFNSRLPNDLYRWLTETAHHRGLSKNKLLIESLEEKRSGGRRVVVGPGDKLR